MYAKSSLLSISSFIVLSLFCGCMKSADDVARTAKVAWIPKRSAMPHKGSTGLLNSKKTAAMFIGNTELDIPMLLDIAFENSPDTHRAWEMAKVAAARKGQAYSIFYPAVTISGTAEHDLSNVLTNGARVKSEGKVYYPTVELTMSVFRFGAHIDTAKAAKQALYAANYQYNRSLQTLSFNVQKCYFDLDSTKSMVVANEKNLEDARCSCERAEIRLKSGLGSVQDYLQAKASFSESQFDLENARASVETARANLSIVIGTRVAQNIEIYHANYDEISEDFVNNVDDLIDDSLKSRPDILASYSELMSKNMTEKELRAEFLPELVVGFSGNRQKYEHVSGEFDNHTAYMKLQWEIFNGFRDTYRILEAKAEKEKARNELRKVEIEVAADVWTKYHGFKSCIKQFAAAKNLLQASQESFDAMNIAYQNGLAKFNDLMSAQNQLAKARTSHVYAKNNLSKSLIELSYATGGLVSSGNSVTKKIVNL